MQKNNDLFEYITILKKRKNIIVSILTISMVLTITFLYFSTPLFTASSQVLIEKNTGKANLDSSYYYSYEPEFLETQSEIIRSENVAHKVIKNLDLLKNYPSYFIPKSESVGKFSYLQKLGNIFSPRTIEHEKNSNNSLQDTDSIGKNLDDMVAAKIQSGLRVTSVKDTKIVNISYTSEEPILAQIITDAVVKAYMDEMLDMKLTLSSYSLKWMTEKAKEEKQRLESSESGLQKFMRENDLVTVENKLTVLPQKLSDYGSQLTKAEAEKQTLQEQIKLIQAVSNNIEKLENLPMFANNEVLKSIREKIYSAKQNKQELSNQFGPKHPKMIKINDELKILQDERKAEVDRVVSSLTNQYNLAVTQTKSLNEALKTIKAEMLNLNERFMEYSAMKREADSNRVLYDTLQAGIKKESVTEQAQDINIWVIKKAKKPVSASFPDKKKTIFLGIFAGLFSGLLITWLIEYLDNSIKQPKDIQERFGLTVLGAIELLKEKNKTIEAYVRDNPLSPIAESYRLVRTNLLLSAADRPPGKILVSSMNPQEGKSSTTINIGRVLAQSSNRVLIIDCDLRRPRMNDILEVEHEKGLSSYLAGHDGEINIVDLPIEKISFIPSGPIPPNPAELLGSQRMKKLMDKLSERFDFVILDSPPILSVTDSLTLSKFVDGTIVVVRSGKTTVEMLGNGLQKLVDVNAKILGIVLNCVKREGVENFYYGYNSYYAKDAN